MPGEKNIKKIIQYSSSQEAPFVEELYKIWNWTEEKMILNYTVKKQTKISDFLNANSYNYYN